MSVVFSLYSGTPDEYDLRQDAEEKRYEYERFSPSFVEHVNTLASEIELEAAVTRFVRSEDARRNSTIQNAIDGVFSTKARRASR